MSTNPQIRIIQLPETTSISATYGTEYVAIESVASAGRKINVSNFLNTAGSNLFYTIVTGAANTAIATFNTTNNTLTNNPNATIGGTGIITALGFQSSSSKKLKKNIRPIEDALDTVNALEGVKFIWKKTGDFDIGLLAEDVFEVVPEAVGLDDETKEPKSIDYSKIVPVLIEAIKELTARVKILESKSDA